MLERIIKDMFQVFITIAPLFSVILAGFIFTKIKLASPDWTKTLNYFALRVGFPTLIFTSLAKSTINFSEESLLLIVNSIYLLSCFGLAILVSKIFEFSQRTKLTLFIIFPFGNIAYLGMPLLSQVYGAQVLPQVSLVVGLYLFWLFTFGVYYLEKSKNGKNSFVRVLINLAKNPLLIAVFTGILTNIAGLSTRNILFQTAEMLSKAATPVVLFSIGIFISQIKLGSIKEWSGIGIYAIVKLLLLPALLYLGVLLLNFKSEAFNLSVVEASMPLALTPYALSQEYNMDSEFITKAIVLTTILSIFSIPFWIVIFR